VIANLLKPRLSLSTNLTLTLRPKHKEKHQSECSLTKSNSSLVFLFTLSPLLLLSFLSLLSTLTIGCDSSSSSVVEVGGSKYEISPKEAEFLHLERSPLPIARRALSHSSRRLLEITVSRPRRTRKRKVPGARPSFFLQIIFPHPLQPFLSSSHLALVRQRLVETEGLRTSSWNNALYRQSPLRRSPPRFQPLNLDPTISKGSRWKASKLGR